MVLKCHLVSKAIRFETYVISSSLSIQIKKDFKHLNQGHFGDFDGGTSILKERGILEFFRQIYPSFHWTALDISKNYCFISEKFVLEFIPHRVPHLFSTQRDWKRFDIHLLKQFNAFSLLTKHPSLLGILQHNYPEIPWERNRIFPELSLLEEKRIHIDRFILRSFGFVRAVRQLGDVTYGAVRGQPGGSSILSSGNVSPYRVFLRVYPEFGARRGSKRLLLERYLLEHFGHVERQQDLVDLTMERMWEHPGASTILSRKSLNPHQVFSELYPELIIQQRYQYGYWSNMEHNFLIQKMMKSYTLKGREAWYRLSIDQISRVYGKGVSKRNVVRLLDFWYPEEVWEVARFSERINKRARQRDLGSKLRELFKDEVIFEDHLMKVAERIYVFDFYLPGLKLVIEYQGEQHYFEVLKWLTLEEQKKKDEDKGEICRVHGLKLVLVPYWWDNSTQALKHFIY